jgi:predicted secreted Zn-dependent protease
MCSSLMAAWDGEARDVEQHIALVVALANLSVCYERPKEAWLAAPETVFRHWAVDSLAIT